MSHIKLELPWPPSLNSYKSIGATVRTKNGKMYQKRVNSKATVAYYYEVYLIGKRIHGMEGTKFFIDSTISIGATVYLYPPSKVAKRRWDLDNRLKVLLDSLIHAKIIADDSQITRLYAEKMGIINADGKVMIDLYELGHDGAIKNAQSRADEKESASND